MSKGNDYADDYSKAVEEAAASASSPEEAIKKVQQLEMEMLANNPFVPPKEGCPINSLPNELLSHIFWLGYLEDGEEDEEDEEDEDDWEDEDEDEEEEEEGGDEKPDALLDVPEDVLPAMASPIVVGGFDLGAALNRAYRMQGRWFSRAPGSGNDNGEGSDHSCEDCARSLSSIEDDDDFEDEDEEDDDRYTLPFHVLVSHVCQHWRSVALDLPALWTKIDFREGAPYERSRIMLERSRNNPIQIDINCDMTTSSPLDDEMDIRSEDRLSNGERLIHSLEDVGVMLDILCPHIGRWQSFEFSVQEYSYMHRVLERLETLPGAPILETLQLYHYDDNEDDTSFTPAELNQHFNILQGNAPNLRDVALWGVHIHWPVLCMSQSDCEHESCPTGILSNARDLELAYHPFDVRPSYAALSSYLRLSTQLHTLTLCQSGPAGQPSDWPSTYEGAITLPSLREFVMMYMECGYACALLDRLIMPQIESLAVDFDGEDYSRLAQHLAGPTTGELHGKSLLSRLERLKIAGLPADESAIGLMLEQLDQLEALNINMDTVESVWFEKLVHPRPSESSSMSSSSTTVAKPAADMYCPSLTLFTVTGLDGADVRTLVNARKSKGIPLKKVFMSNNSTISGRDLRYLRKHVEFEFFEPSDEDEDIEIVTDDSDSSGLDD